MHEGHFKSGKLVQKSIETGGMTVTAGERDQSDLVMQECRRLPALQDLVERLGTGSFSDSGRNQSYQHLDFGLVAWEQTFCHLKPPSLWCFVMKDLET